MNRSFSNWMYRLLKNANVKKTQRTARRAPRLGVETLECRVVPATYNFDATANTLSISLDTDESLGVTEVAGNTIFTISTGTFTAVGSDVAVGDTTNTITIADADLTTSLAIDDALATGPSTNDVSFDIGTVTSAAIDVNLAVSGADTILFNGGALSSSGTVTLSTANGSITSPGATAIDVTASALAMSATTGIGAAGAGNAIITSVNNVEAATDTGGVNIANISTPLTIGGVNGTLTGVSAAGGDISITSDGGLTVGATATEGVSDSGSGDITLTSTGVANDLVINAPVAATGGNGSVFLNSDNDINVNAAVSVTGTGGITLTADSDTDGTGVFTSTLGGTLTTAGGIVTITAADVSIGDTINVTTAALADVFLQPSTDAAVIHLGSDTAFGVTDTELDLITASAVTIGTATNTGGIVVDGQVSLDPTKVATLGLITGGAGGAITDNTVGEQTDISVQNLLMVTDSGIGAGVGGAGGIDISVSNLALSNSNATTGAINIFNTATVAFPTLNLTSVGDGFTTVTGVINGNANGATGSITIATTGAMDVQQAVTAASGGTGAINLDAGTSFTLDASTTIQSGDNAVGGDVTIRSNVGNTSGTEDITLGATSNILTRGSITLDADPDMPFPTASDGIGGGLNIPTTAALAGPGGTLAFDINLRAGTDITASNFAATDDITLITSANIVDDGDDTTFLSAGNSISLTAGGSIGSATPLTTADVESAATATPSATFLALVDVDYGSLNPTGTLTLAQTGGLGNIGIRKVGATGFSTSTILGTNGPGGLVGTGNQLALVSASGPFTVDSNFVVSATNDADLFLATTGGNNFIINAASSLMNGGGTATTIMTSGSNTAAITDLAAGDTNADITAHNLVLVTTGGDIGSLVAPLEFDAVKLDGFTNGKPDGVTVATGGSAFLTDTLTGLVVGQFNAGTGDVTLSSLDLIPSGLGTGSSLVALTANDGIPEIIGNVITLDTSAATATGATGQIGFFTGGAAQFFEVNATTLNATTNASRVWISDTAGGVAIGSVNVGADTAFLRVRNGGDLTSATVDTVADIVAGTVNLSAPEGGNLGGAVGSPLEIDAATALVANVTGTGNINILDTAGGLTVQKVATGAGTVNLDSAAALILGTGTSTTPVVSASTTVTLNATGAITHGGGAITDVMAATLVVTNATGANSVGVNGTPVTTAVGTLSAATGSGGVFIANTGALGLNNVSATGAGNIAISVADTAASGEDLTVNALNAVSTGTGNIALSAGDNLIVNGFITTSGTGVISLAGDTGGAVDAAGAVITISSATALTAAPGLGTAVNLIGNTDADTFNVIPQTNNTQFSITGNTPTTVPGDTLAVTGDTGTVLTSTAIGAGNFTFTNGGTATFTGIESLSTATPFALVLDLTTLGFGGGSVNPDLVNVSTTAGATPILNVTVQNNGTAPVASIFSGAAANVTSITINGSSDSEAFTIDETNPGIPTGTFNGNASTTGGGDVLRVNTTNAVNTTFIPGAPGAGTFTFANRNNVNFTGIETINPIVITISATDGTASERGADESADPGVFTLTRLGSVTNALTVNFTISGTATNGVDYQTISGQATFAAGSATTVVTINVLNNSLIDGTRTVTLTLQPGIGYSFTAGASATVSILDNDSVNRRYAVATAVGSQVIVTDPAASTSSTISLPIGNIVSVAVGDVNGDGVTDVAIVDSFGALSFLVVYDGATGAQRLAVPLGAAFSVAIGDVDGDGRGEIILGLLSSAPAVAVLDGLSGSVRTTFSAFPGFATGVNVAAADLDGDGKAEIIVAPTGVAPLIAVYNGNGNLVSGFLAFSPALGGVGLTITAGDLDGDGKAEIIAGAHFGDPSKPIVGDFVVTYNADGTLRNAIPVPVITTSISQFGPPVATADVNGDGAQDILLSFGPIVGILDGMSLGLIGGTIPFPGNTGGVYVA